ncbi:MAG: NAD(P)/FAD-dependent oxidoreductase, partial [Butyricicoccus sp.]
MSIFVSGIRQPFGEPEESALEAARRLCGLGAADGEASVYRVSIDARHGRIHQVYTIVLDGLDNEEAFAASLQMPSVRYKETRPFAPVFGKQKLAHRPVVVGLGPAGLFAAHTLARFGYRPLVLERGDAIDARDAAVERFWSGGALDPDSNIQFGEGGAGAYSDGKLTTRINDPLCDEILRVLVQFGAPREILRMAKPHIGTDVLKGVVRAMREDIAAHGGAVKFRTPVTGLCRRSGVLAALQTGKDEIACEQAVLAIGHSARDTFFALHDAGVYMEPKAFSVGVRVEHLQEDIGRALYGKAAGM